MNFSNFGFKQFLVEKIGVLNFRQPTPVQLQVIPLLKKHRNVIVQAPTGTGKSHAFLLPLVNNLDSTKAEEVQLIIVVPTQELGAQLFGNLRFLIEKTNFRVELHTGKDSNKNQTLYQPTIIVATPQRLVALHNEQNRVITTATALVVDEADMILEQGFAEDLDFLIHKMKQNLQLAFFSATIGQQLRTFLKKYVKQSFWIEIKSPAVALTKNYLIDIGEQNYWTTLSHLLRSLNPFLCLIFVNHKTEIISLRSKLEKLNLGRVAELHSGMDQRSRYQTFKRMRNGDFKYVVVTDLAARGLDIPGVSHVISLGLPKNLDFYRHRSGRTGRNQNFGESYLLVNAAKNQSHLRKLEAKGIEFVPIKLKLNAQHSFSFQEKNHKTSTQRKTKELVDDLKRLSGAFDKEKIKPNYKKKRKQAIDKVIKKHHRKEVIAKMRQNKKGRYKKRRASIFEK